MKEFYLEMHSQLCPSHRMDKDNIWINFCDLNPERYLFFVGSSFALVTYHSCMEKWDRYEFKKSIIEKAISDNKIFDLYEVNRGVNIKDNLREFRIRNKSLKKYIQQIN